MVEGENEAISVVESKLIAKRWQNLTNQPLEALKEVALLYSMAKLRIARSSVSS